MPTYIAFRLLVHCIYMYMCCQDQAFYLFPPAQVAYKLLELYIKLRELAHVQYINEGNIGPMLSCQFTTEDIEERVRETEVILTMWTHKVANLRKEFSWLLFFSLPKLLRLYRLLSEEQENMDVHLKRIVHEISFLCVNNAEVRKRMKTKVQVCGSTSKRGRGRERRGGGWRGERKVSLISIVFYS